MSHIKLMVTQLLAALKYLSLVFFIGQCQISFAQQDILNNFFTEVNTFEADFSQTVTDETGDILEQTQGQFVLSRPGKFSWIYGDPLPQKIISNGENIWLYDEDLEQVTIRQYQSAVSGSPAELLAGTASIVDFYEVENNTNGNNVGYLLTPKDPDSQFSEVKIKFIDGVLSELSLMDSFLRVTTLTFISQKENAHVSQDFFEFEVPDNVDVIDDTL